MKKAGKIFGIAAAAVLAVAAGACSQTQAPAGPVLQESSQTSSNGQGKESRSAPTTAMTATKSQRALQDLADDFYAKAEDAQTAKELAREAAQTGIRIFPVCACILFRRLDGAPALPAEDYSGSFKTWPGWMRSPVSPLSCMISVYRRPDPSWVLAILHSESPRLTVY